MARGRVNPYKTAMLEVIEQALRDGLDDALNAVKPVEYFEVQPLTSTSVMVRIKPEGKWAGAHMFEVKILGS